MLAHPEMPERWRRLLLRQRGAFLFGNTAPDFGTVTGYPRAKSHFFDMPMLDRRPAHLRLLERHPSLCQPAALAEDHAAFLAGYLAHLWLDQAWIVTFFEPIFGPDVRRGSFHQRLVDHNLLRAHLDLTYRGMLGDDIGDLIRHAQPQGWLTFAKDSDLAKWRDHLEIQLKPGGSSQTVRIFARRLGIPQRKFAARLASREEMEKAVFRFLPPDLLASFWERSLLLSIGLVAAYLYGDVEKAASTNRPFQRNPISEPSYIGGGQ